MTTPSSGSPTRSRTTSSTRWSSPTSRRPEPFLGLLETPSRGDGARTREDATSDEVDVDEDADQAIETDERDRWIAFLSWIGVNRALRPVHFHDVEDDATGWLTTKGLAQPHGWAFGSLGDTWDRFGPRSGAALAASRPRQRTTPYLYEVHDLDQIVPLVAGRDERRHRHGRAGAARAPRPPLVVVRSRSPTARSRSSSRTSRPGSAPSRSARWPRSSSTPATTSGCTDCGRAASARRGTARGGPSVTWRPSAELERRFGRRRRRPRSCCRSSSSRRPAGATRSARSPSGSACAASRRRRPSRSTTPGCCASGWSELFCARSADRRSRPARGHQARLPTDVRAAQRPLGDAGARSRLRDAPLLADTARRAALPARRARCSTRRRRASASAAASPAPCRRSCSKPSRRRPRR